MSDAKSIGALNRLPAEERLEYVKLMLPPALFERFAINADDLTDSQGHSLYQWLGRDTSDVEITLHHQFGAPDPLAYFHLTDTISGQIHVLLSVINDPQSPRFDVDQMPDGTPTKFGIFQRNVEAEKAAFAAGLAPGQIRRGLRILRESVISFEKFIARLGHDMYFVEPLYYHNAVIFERYGFAYQQGRRWMQSLNTRFSDGGDAFLKLDGSTVFRAPLAAKTMRGRSWAIHDNVLGEPYTGVTMYKRVGQHAGIVTFTGEGW